MSKNIVQKTKVVGFFVNGELADQAEITTSECTKCGNVDGYDPTHMMHDVFMGEHGWADKLKDRQDDTVRVALL